MSEPLEPAITSPPAIAVAGLRGIIDVTEQRVLRQRAVSPFAFAAVKHKEMGMLKVRAQEQADVVVLHFNGRIVRGLEIAILRCAVISRVEATLIALDFSQVDVVDAGGLTALLELREWARANGIEFRLVNLTKCVQSVFAITRLDSVFEVTSDAEVLSASMLELEPCA